MSTYTYIYVCVCVSVCVYVCVCVCVRIGAFRAFNTHMHANIFAIIGQIRMTPGSLEYIVD